MQTGSLLTFAKSFSDRHAIQRWPREELEQYQLHRLGKLIESVLPINHFYQSKLGGKEAASQFKIESLEAWKSFPTSTKSDWLSDSVDGVALHHTYQDNECQTYYHRYHRTSGTRGRPMVIQDTKEDWEWWTNTWQYVLDASGIEARDRILMAFSFGPFIGFWSAHDACLKRGCLVIPSGGMSTAARIDLVESARPTVLFATPTYALHLAHEAALRGISLRDRTIRTVFVAGEPGGSIPSVRQQIEQAFGARVMDHAGATEIGPWGFGASDGCGLHVIESEFIAEFLPIDASFVGERSSDLHELVLTSLGRVGAPALRYRTGDIVKPVASPDSSTNFVRLEGGILGRVDDMFIVRGVNIFPSSIEAILRQFESVGEFRINVMRRGSLDEVSIEAEVELDRIPSIEESLNVQLGLRIPVKPVPYGSLPNSDGKARRIRRTGDD